MIGEPAPNFTLKNASKEDVSLSDYAGKKSYFGVLSWRFHRCM